MNKECTKCKNVKDLSEFHQNKGNKDNLSYMCKDCKKLYRKDYYYKFDKFKKLQTLYGIDREYYEDLLKVQNNSCAICKTKTNNLVVDHCHSTKKVRGLLCSNCNLAIGLLKDDIKISISVTNYLINFNKK